MYSRRVRQQPCGLPQSHKPDQTTRTGAARQNQKQCGEVQRGARSLEGIFFRHALKGFGAEFYFRYVGIKAGFANSIDIFRRNHTGRNFP